MLAYVDPRPWIFVLAVPVLFFAAWLVRRLFRPKAGYFTVFGLLFFGFIATFQFVLYGPFIGQKRVVATSAKWRISTDTSPPKVTFSFTELAYGEIVTSDRDVIAHVSDLKSDRVTLGVQLSYDFGRNRGMSLNFAYVDGILFRPE